MKMFGDIDERENEDIGIFSHWKDMDGTPIPSAGRATIVVQGPTEAQIRDLCSRAWFNSMAGKQSFEDWWNDNKNKLA